MPFLRRSFPFRFDLPQREVDQLNGRIVVRESDGLSHQAVQALDRIGGVDNLSDFGREGEERSDLLPLSAPAGHDRRFENPRMRRGVD